MNSSNTNTGGWDESAMRTTHLPAIMSLMPAEVQAGIKEVNKATNAQVSWNNSLVVSKDKLFLLSQVEVSGTDVTYGGEGSQYAYYKEGNSTIKKISGTDTAWFTRSYGAGNSVVFRCVWANGSMDAYNANTTQGVAFAFCF